MPQASMYVLQQPTSAPWRAERIIPVEVVVAVRHPLVAHGAADGVVHHEHRDVGVVARGAGPARRSAS